MSKKTNLSAEDSVVMSLHPNELDLAVAKDWKIELKLDWEDLEKGGTLDSDKTVLELLSEHGVNPEKLVDVHLPPGTGSNPGMSATRENIGAISDFSYNKMSDLEDSFLTTHPPKKFRYLDQLWVFHDLFDSVDLEISIENTSDESDWYTPEAAAFFGFVGSEYHDSFENLFLTIDSAHLPQDDYVDQNFDTYYDPEEEGFRWLMDQVDISKEWLFEIDYERVGDIVREVNQDLESEDNVFPIEYISYIGNNFQEVVEEYFPDEEGIITNNSLTGDSYLPLLRTLSMTGDRVKSVHLNDPERNDVPSIEDYRNSECLQTSLRYIGQTDIYVVIEPENELDRQKADSYMENVTSMIEKSENY